MTSQELQNVANDTDAPHVSSVTNRIVVDHFRCDKLSCSEKHLPQTVTLNKQILKESTVARSQPHLGAGLGVELARQAEVDELDFVAVASNAEDVLRLQVQMQDVLTVHVLHA